MDVEAIWINSFKKGLMEFLQMHDINQLQLWTPVIGGIVIWIGLNLRVVNLEDEDDLD